MIELEVMDQSKLTIEALTEKYIDETRALWNYQYDRVISRYSFLPQDWKNDSSFFNFIESHIRNKNSIIVRYEGRIAGYMTYDMFDFHSEKTAFFPIMAHSAREEYKASIYRIMYSHVSERLVREGCLNHFFTFFASDGILKQYLFELGFGLYVVDAFQDARFDCPKKGSDRFQIREAEVRDIKTIHSILIEFNDYYQSAPLFLKRDVETIEEIEECITGKNNVIFIAQKENVIVGFINIRIPEENDQITLATKKTGLINPLGAYIRKEYRHIGIGTQLLNEVFSWCNQNDIENIHVDFESANQYAHQFWPKYFVPIMFSVKRRINNDF